MIELDLDNIQALSKDYPNFYMNLDLNTVPDLDLVNKITQLVSPVSDIAITLVIGDVEYNCHPLYLALRSDYFKKMLSNDMIERT